MPTRPNWLVELFGAEVEKRIQNDPRTIANPLTFLDCRTDRIFEAIGGGQADFDKPVGNLVGADLALLYAAYNQPRHLDELAKAFEQSLVSNQFSVDRSCEEFDE